MGYTVTVNVGKGEERRKALAFMQAHYKPWKALVGDDEIVSLVRGPLEGPDLSYDRGHSRIGFDYNSCVSMAERHYLWCLIHWMALTFGDSKKFKALGGSSPYYVYDGHEHNPVLVGDAWIKRPMEMKGWTRIEEDGWFDPDEMKGGVVDRKLKCLFAKMIFGMDPRKGKKIVRAELSRLTEAWKQHG